MQALFLAGNPQPCGRGAGVRASTAPNTTYAFFSTSLTISTASFSICWRCSAPGPFTIDFVRIFRTGWTRSEPAIFGHHFQTTNRKHRYPALPSDGP